MQKLLKLFLVEFVDKIFHISRDSYSHFRLTSITKLNFLFGCKYVLYLVSNVIFWLLMYATRPAGLFFL